MLMAKKPKTNTGVAPSYDKRKMFAFFCGTVAKLRRDWEALSHLFMDRARRDYLNRMFPRLRTALARRSRFRSTWNWHNSLILWRHSTTNQRAIWFFAGYLTTWPRQSERQTGRRSKRITRPWSQPLS